MGLKLIMIQIPEKIAPLAALEWKKASAAVVSKLLINKALRISLVKL
jgi:hypothetical protein